MMTKIKKYQVLIISAIIICVGVIILMLYTSLERKVDIAKVDKKTYSFQYDRTWKLQTQKEDYIELKHNSGSKVIIQITKLVNEYQYATMDELIDELMYNILMQNSNYKLLSNQKAKFTKYQFEGYKLLYENELEQAMVVLYKKGNNLISISYEASDDYFDILLDSVQYIIYNLNIKEETFELKSEIKALTSSVSYSTDKDFDVLLTKSITYKIAANNYSVEYSIPNIFVLNSLNTLSNYFNYYSDKGSMTMSVNILNRNIYEYLDKKETTNLYNNYQIYQNSSNYSDFTESLTKLNNKYDSYIYKNTYFDHLIDSSRKNENVELIYALDNNHTLKIVISSTKLPITEKLVKMIDIKKVENYASNIKIEKENGFLKGYLQRFTDYNKKEIDYIALKLPDKYQEVDKNENMNLERNYVLNYNEDLKLYDYNISFNLTTLSEKDIIDIIDSAYINSQYGDAKKLQFVKDLTLNDKKFAVYDGGYSDVSGIMFTDINRKRYYVSKKVLFYKMPDQGFIYIDIDGNGKEVTDDMLNELTNFTVEVKNY